MKKIIFLILSIVCLTLNAQIEEVSGERKNWLEHRGVMNNNFEYLDDRVDSAETRGLVKVFNNTGVGIPAGKPVRFNGAIGDSIVLISRVGARDSLYSLFFGLTADTIPPNDWGHCVDKGEVYADFTELTVGLAVYVSEDSSLTTTEPAHPNHIILVGGTIKEGVDGIFYVNPSLSLDRQLDTKSYTLPTGVLGTYYEAGFYRAATANANLTQASTTQTYGSAGVAYSAHPFVVCGGSGTVDAGVVGLMVTGTYVDDEGTLTTSYTDTIIHDITSVALNEYYESEKFVGTVTFELITISGSPTTYSLDFNFGYAKYEDFGNRDFYVTGIECVGRGGGNDSGFGIELLHHSSTGWTYSATAFVPGNGVIASSFTDLSGYDDLANGIPWAWKRTNLNYAVDGTSSEGVIYRTTITQNNAVQDMDLHINVALK